ncbi:NifB/NifX family molybdenum-iron cluster-binding protein [Proteiniclasticum sp. C24MP]|uniref:NifB/NifX family molybdenum-iron cluster-binding protein n=1 Tax=Proteiniclasticum sp. C24MP TaxID=3374101 RepID=UPI003753F30D
MRIAVAKTGELISEHFGHSEGFDVFEVKDREVLSTEFISSPEHTHGAMPGFLGQQNIDILIAGGLGQGAVTKLSERGIKVISGIKGQPMEAVKKYMKGELSSSGVPCSGHENHHHDLNHDHHGGGGCGGHHGR